mgnify:CR=1 FL=1
MTFSEAFLDELKNANDIVSVVSSYATLKKQGKNHGDAMVDILINQHFHGQKINNPHGNCDTTKKYA